VEEVYKIYFLNSGKSPAVIDPKLNNAFSPNETAGKPKDVKNSLQFSVASVPNKTK